MMVLVIIMINLEGLLDFRRLVKANPNYVRFANSLNKLFQLHIKEEDFCKFTTNNDVKKPDFTIVCKKESITIGIRKNCYIISRTTDNGNFTIKKYYTYKDSKLIMEKFIEKYASNTFEYYVDDNGIKITIENPNLTFKRESAIFDYENPNNGFQIKYATQLSSVKTNEISQDDTIICYDNPEELSYIRFGSLKEEYKYKAGANLNYTNDYVRINPPDLENKPFFRKLGIDTYSPKINPKILFICDYKEEGIDKKLELEINKYNGIVHFLIKNDEKSDEFALGCSSSTNINLEELAGIKQILKTVLSDHPCLDLLMSFLSDVETKVYNRSFVEDVTKMVSYKDDIFDFYINKSRKIGIVPEKETMEIALDFYCDKEKIVNLVNCIKIPDIKLKKGKNLQLAKNDKQ